MPTLGRSERLIFTISDASGNGVPSQTPTVIIQKQSNGYYFNGVGFTPTAVELALLESDAITFPGRYHYDFNQALDTSISNQEETYAIRYKNTGIYSLIYDEEISFYLPTTVSYTQQAQPGIEFSRPGFQSPEQSYLVSKGNEKRIKATFIDSLGVYYDPYQLRIKIYDHANNLVLDETILSGISGANLKRSSTGNYFVDYIPTYSGDYLIEWFYRDVSGGELFSAQSYLYSVDLQVLNLFPLLKNQIDKAQKDLGIFGYTQENLYLYLKGGLSEINRVPPITSLSFSSFPVNSFSQLLIDVSSQVAMASQGLLSIDTDANYSLQGNSFTIDHWSKISAYISLMNSRIDLALKQLKFSYLPKSGVKIERGPGFRSVQLWNSSPSGVSMGNVLGVR